MANIVNRNSIYSVICPHCFQSFSVVDVCYIDYRDLGKRSYPKYTDYCRKFLKTIPNLDNAPNIFSLTNPPEDPFCAPTPSGDITHARACPHCFNLLPPASGRIKTAVITVISHDNDKASVYLTKLLHSLSNKMLENYGISFLPSDYDTAQRFYQNMEKPFYITGEEPRHDREIKPLVYELNRLSNEFNETVLSDNQVIYNKAQLLIYTIDEAQLDKYPEFYRQVVSASDGIILLTENMATQKSFDDGSEVLHPITGLLKENFTMLFGTKGAQKNLAIVLTNPENIRSSAKTQKLWNKAMVQTTAPKNVVTGFPYSYYRKISRLITKGLKKDYGLFSGFINSIVTPSHTMNFIAPGLSEKGGEIYTEIPLLWLLNTLNIIQPKGKIKK